MQWTTCISVTITAHEKKTTVFQLIKMSQVHLSRFWSYISFAPVDIVPQCCPLTIFILLGYPIPNISSSVPGPNLDADVWSNHLPRAFTTSGGTLDFLVWTSCSSSAVLFWCQPTSLMLLNSVNPTLFCDVPYNMSWTCFVLLAWQYLFLPFVVCWGSGSHWVSFTFPISAKIVKNNFHIYVLCNRHHIWKG